MKIAVVSIGGGGNVINHIIETKNLDEYIKNGNNINFIAINTDFYVLKNSKASQKILVGNDENNTIKKQEIVEKTIFEKEYENIKTSFSYADIIIIVAGLDGNTGSFVTPIVAQIAKDIGAFTSCILTKPFSWEGEKKMHIANEAVEKIENIIDKLYIYENDDILEIIDKNSGMKDAFQLMDNKIYDNIKEIINQGEGNGRK